MTSLNKGEVKKSQKYHNKKGYKVQFNPKFEEVAKKAPLDRLCQRCRDQIEWKIQYGKYKPAKNVSKCNKCNQKNITKAYRNVCDKCADAAKICSKCLEDKEIIVDEPKPHLDKNGVDREKLKNMEDYLKTLRERSRRIILKKLLAGKALFENGLFVDADSRKPIENLKFKVDYDDKEDLWDDDEEDDVGSDEEDEDEDEDDDEEDLIEKKESKKNKEEKAKRKDSETKEESKSKKDNKKDQKVINEINQENKNLDKQIKVENNINAKVNLEKTKEKESLDNEKNKEKEVIAKNKGSHKDDFEDDNDDDEDDDDDDDDDDFDDLD